MSEFDEHDGPTNADRTISRRDFFKRAGAIGLSVFLPPSIDKSSSKNQPTILDNKNTEQSVSKPNRSESQTFLTNLENIHPSQNEASVWNNLNLWISQNKPIQYTEATMAETSNVQTFIPTNDIVKHRAMTLSTMFKSQNPYLQKATSRYYQHPENLRTIHPDSDTVQIDYLKNADSPMSMNGLQDAINLAAFEAYVNVLDTVRKDLLAKGETEDNADQAIFRYAQGDGKLTLANTFFQTQIEAYLVEKQLIKDTNFGESLNPPQGTETYISCGGDIHSPEWLKTVSTLASLTHTV